MEIKRKLKEFDRVIRITKKPTPDEFKAASKITLVGILIIGLIGLTISIIFNIAKMIF
ncbi:MAG: protein translocase SEC61 complex subunit gamma [Candidatus Aenigmarchaeota archaeon]|nr:protein translocase SEC61 complex subunit gamma [Candidatus Aenigmarchaeota archaeon]MCK5321712.1 protein translocase SEC61 complex subunit gamma [Candidatus Aenigmarchaeota archaeon]